MHSTCGEELSLQKHEQNARETKKCGSRYYRFTDFVQDTDEQLGGAGHFSITSDLILQEREEDERWEKDRNMGWLVPLGLVQGVDVS